MIITPLDIQNAEFKVSFRGYNQSEVDSFLNKILVDYEKLHKENQVVKEELKRLKNDIGKYKNIEDNLSATLVLAQETANTLKETAEKEAELVVKEADIKAKAMLEKAQREVREKEKELRNLSDRFNNYRFKALSFLETQYRIMKAQDESLAEVTSTSEKLAAEQPSVADKEEPAKKCNKQKVD